MIKKKNIFNPPDFPNGVEGLLAPGVYAGATVHWQ
jgi:hypothetical protein